MILLSKTKALVIFQKDHNKYAEGLTEPLIGTVGGLGVIIPLIFLKVKKRLIFAFNKSCTKKANQIKVP
jgi:hypothetical protein